VKTSGSQTRDFCVCGRNAPPPKNEASGSFVPCAENDDVETWPWVEATCWACRGGGRCWVASLGIPRGRKAIGGPCWESPDWEAINRSGTKLSNLISQVLAASRLTSRDDAGGGGGGGYNSGEELSDVKDSPKLLSLTEDAGGIRDFVVNDWARIRILDGH